jgi:hypothetical protein
MRGFATSTKGGPEETANSVKQAEGAAKKVEGAVKQGEEAVKPQEPVKPVEKPNEGKEFFDEAFKEKVKDYGTRKETLAAALGLTIAIGGYSMFGSEKK